MSMLNKIGMALAVVTGISYLPGMNIAGAAPQDDIMQRQQQVLQQQ